MHWMCTCHAETYLVIVLLEIYKVAVTSCYSYDLLTLRSQFGFRQTSLPRQTHLGRGLLSTSERLTMSSAQWQLSLNTW